MAARSIALLLLLLALALPLVAQQQTVEISSLQVARSSSIAVVGPTGEAITGVLVEEKTPDWKATIATTKTDEKGFFSLSDSAGKVHYLVLSCYGFNPLRVRVKVDTRKGKVLRLVLYVAT